MSIWVYDIETMKNVFSAVFIHADTQEQKVFLVYADENEKLLRDDRSLLIDFINQDNLVFVGHNSIHFDDIVLTAFLHYPTLKPKNISGLAHKLIKESETFRLTDIYKELAWSKLRKWRSIDTLAVTRVNQQRLGLKYAAIVLQHERVQDLPIEPDEFIPYDQLDTLLDYNVNDVIITLKLYRELSDILSLREDVSEIFNVDVRTANDTEIAKNIFNTLYAEKTGLNYTDFKELRSPREVVYVKDCISDFVRFETKPFQDLRKELEKMVLHESNNYRYKKNFHFDGMTYNLGVGGLHSEDSPAIFEATDVLAIVDRDFSSWYPFIMLRNNFFPEHLDEKFPKIFEDIVLERIEAKKLGKTDKFAATKAQALKIAINSTFGLMGSQYYWLYDPKTLISVTISGQLLLLDLIEKLYLVGIQTISANTDGIVCLIPNDKKDVYYQVCNDTEKRLNIGLEETVYKKYIRRDVNNYITIKDNGEVKTKGVFSPGKWDGKRWKQPLSKGYKYPIVAISMYKYFTEGTPIETTIKNHDNIHDFMITQRVSDKFSVEFRDIDDDGELAVDKQQKTNRLIVTTYGGSISKTDGDRSLSIIAGKTVQILNDVNSIDPKNYPIDYQWYIDETYKIVDLIEPPQPKLFF